MPVLVVAVSSRALFHIEDGDRVFREHGQQAFDTYMREREHIPLRPGVAFGLVRKLLALNDGASAPRSLVDVALLPRNSMDVGVRITESLRHYNLAIERAVFCSGGDRFRYAKAFGAHLIVPACEFIDAMYDSMLLPSAECAGPEAGNGSRISVWRDEAPGARHGLPKNSPSRSTR